MRWTGILMMIGIVNVCRAEDPANVPSSDLAAIVAVVSGGEPVRITRGASGFNLYGKAQPGQIAAAAGGLSVSYGGMIYRAARVAGGWSVTGNGMTARVASRAGGHTISGSEKGSALTTGETRIRINEKNLRSVPTATGGQDLR